MHLHPPEVAHDLEETSANHADHVPPCSMANSEDQIGEEGDGKDGQVKDISG